MILQDYLDHYDHNVDANAWFEGVTQLAVAHGFAAKPKEYKASPDSFKGHVGDVSMILRLAVTGKSASPDLYSVMQILGKETVLQRLSAALAAIESK